MELFKPLFLQAGRKETADAKYSYFQMLLKYLISYIRKFNFKFEDIITACYERTNDSRYKTACFADW